MERQRGANVCEVHYDAFISYRHSELDSFVAENLHKQLEKFRLPVSVIKQKKKQLKKEGKNPKDAKTKISRVFRDKEELPLVTNLADPITNALENSEFLIVICSPRLIESMWCRKEIETFIQMHDREHVLAVLIEGEPDTSFPEELLYREVEEELEGGTIIRKKIPVEPLAADVRGNSPKEIQAKIKSELLRLAAPMFECAYDELRQRHREQRIRNIIAISGSISAVCASFGVVSTTMALQIQQQNVQIKSQSSQLEAQAEEIAEQYAREKVVSAVSRSKESANALEDGDRMHALSIAMDTIEGLDNHVYPAETVYALSNSLRLYENGEHVRPERMIEADTDIEFIKISPDRTKLLTVDGAKQVLIWNPKDTRKAIRVPVQFSYSIMEQDVQFTDDSHLMCLTYDSLNYYVINDDRAELVYDVETGERAQGFVVFDQGKKILLLREDNYAVIDADNGKVIFQAEWMEDPLLCGRTYAGTVSEENNMIAVSLSPSYLEEEEESLLVMIDTTSYEVEKKFPLTYKSVEDIEFDGRRVYVSCNRTRTEDGSYFGDTLTGRLQAFDLDADDELWHFENEDGWVYDISYARLDDSNVMVCRGYSDLYVLDKNTGEKTMDCALESEIVKLGNYQNSENFMAFTRRGAWHIVSVPRKTDLLSNVFSDTTSSNVKIFDIGDDYYVTVPYGSRELTIYRTAVGMESEECFTADDDINKAHLSSDSRYMAIEYYNAGRSVDIYDTDGFQKLWSFTSEDDSPKKVGFFEQDGKQRFYSVFYESVAIYDAETGEVLEERNKDLDGYITKVFGTDNTGRYMYIDDFDGLGVWDLWENKVVKRLNPECGYDSGYQIAFSRDGKTYAIIDTVEEVIHFYSTDSDECLGEWGDDQDKNSEDYVNFMYVNHLFWGAGDDTLYICYQDDRVLGLSVDLKASNSSEICGIVNREDNGIIGEMDEYIYCEGEEFAFIKGTFEGYLVTAMEEGKTENGYGDSLGNTGKVLAHIPDILAYDPVQRVIYSKHSEVIYKTPIFDVEQMMTFGENVRSSSKYAK